LYDLHALAAIKRLLGNLNAEEKIECSPLSNQGRARIKVCESATNNNKHKTVALIFSYRDVKQQKKSSLKTKH
jgi:hypothetical protein